MDTEDDDMDCGVVVGPGACGKPECRDCQRSGVAAHRQSVANAKARHDRTVDRGVLLPLMAGAIKADDTIRRALHEDAYTAAGMACTDDGRDVCDRVAERLTDRLLPLRGIETRDMTLKAALSTYGRHLDDCNVFGQHVTVRGEHPCDCGLDEALTI